MISDDVLRMFFLCANTRYHQPVGDGDGSVVVGG